MKNILDQLNSRLIQTQTKISNSSKLNVRSQKLYII